MTSLALQALQNAEGEGGIDALKAEISGLSGSRGTVAATTKQLYQTLDEGYASLPRASELQQDGEAVQSKLQTLTKNRNVTRKIVDSAYVEELEKMAERIEMTQDAEVIARILEANSVNPGGDLPDLDVDCKGELEHAGQLDRLALLRVQEEGLDTVRRITYSALPPIVTQRIHRSRATCVTSSYHGYSRRTTACTPKGHSRSRQKLSSVRSLRSWRTSTTRLKVPGNSQRLSPRRPRLPKKT